MTLKNLLEHFSSESLSLANVPEDELGNGYEFLIKKFADDSGHTAQEFYTNRTVVQLMVQLLDPKPDESIYDPTCGTGGMLISALAEVKRQGGEHRTAAGEREVKKALRRTLLKYQLHQETELFDKAYGYIKQYY